MTDEEYGRAWCERNGKRPDYCPHATLPPWRWTCHDGPACGLPRKLYYSLGHPTRYATESAAYAEVGATLRELERQAEDIRAVLEGGK